MTENSDKLTPMFEQYTSIKKNYPDALLFFRMGDFYELFFDDAVTASRELQIALTSRGKNGANAVPMCGVPWHASQSYLAQLIDKGYNVAICEQIEDPKTCKGLVARAVTSVVTPGTVLEESSLDARTHNYLGAIFCGLHNNCAFAWADVSTGKWSGIEFRRQADLWQWVGKLAPRELLLVDGQQLPAGFAHENMRLVHQPVVNFEIKRATERLLEAQGVRELDALGLEDKAGLVRACGAILAYLEQTQLRKVEQLLPFKPLDLGRRMLIDELTERNLEIFTRLNGRKGKGTLRHVLDMTVTPMGGRLLEDMLHHPWRDLKIIRQIQDCVAWMYGHDNLRHNLRGILEKAFDMERLIIRISMGRGSARDLFALRQSLEILPDLKNIFSQSDESMPIALSGLLDNMDDLEDLRTLLRQALVEDFSAAENGLIRIGYHAELDRQIELLEHGEQKLREMLEKEREKTGIVKLKLGYNKVFGYYYEVSRPAIPREVPEHFTRRQSLANGERFTTDDLKQLEEELLQASDRREELENGILENLRLHLAANKERILQTADSLAQIDYWQTLAEVGRREDWILPVLNDSCEIHITGGRHPVVESITGKANFVANDFHMDASHRLCLLTGPNMAGKSTILRQVALIALLGQMGAPVPAKSAVLGMVDRLFSRVGASDNLAQGQSTFMVEMMETARIIRQASKRSLIILDEIGRGTSTYDGMAIAWAVVEDLASRCQGQLRTIFATHYHELTALENVISGLYTMNVSVGSYDNNEMVFLHRLLPGPSDKSYGVEVARLAGVPYPVVQRARDILRDLEQNRSKIAVSAIRLPGLRQQAKNESSNVILKEIKNISPDSLDAAGAYELVLKWKTLLEQSGETNG